jgi:hypothetical protein
VLVYHGVKTGGSEFEPISVLSLKFKPLGHVIIMSEDTLNGLGSNE